MENTPTHRSSRTAAILMAAAIAMPIVATSTASAHENSLVSAEIARRELQMAEADQVILDGRKAYQNKKYEEAVAHYRKAVNLLPAGPIAADRRRSYMGHLLDGSIALSTQYRRTGKYTEARELLDNVLDRDPGNVTAKKHLEYLDDPIRTSPTLTYDHVQDVEKVRKLLLRANSYYDQAQFDPAYLEYQEILRIDPYNKAARRGMERVDRAKMDYYRAAYDQTRASMLREVDAAWESTVPMQVRQGQANIGPSTITNNPALYNRQKLQNIILPSVEFEDDATVGDVINSFRQRARELDTDELDPNKKGLNFLIRNTTIVDISAEIGDGGGASQETNKIENIKIGALELRNVPIEEALRQVCQIAGLRYKVEDYSVVILRATEFDNTELEQRTFRVPPDLMTLLGSSGGGGGGAAADDPFGENTGASEQKTVKELLELSGIKFPDEATAGFSRATSTLSVLNTANALDQVEELVNDFLRRKPKQVKMLTKFVEIKQNNSDELGFDWVLSPFGITSNNNFLSGGTLGNGATRTAADFVSGVNGVTVNGIPGTPAGTVNNIITGGNRSGDFGIAADSIDSFLNNPNRTAQSSTVAPGILSLTGLFTDGQVQLIMRGLSQKSGADVMTAPSIVSRSGERATIEIIREFIYPTEYEPPELPNNISTGFTGGNGTATGGATSNAFPVTPATPTAFETRNTGVILEVEPILGDDGYTIDLTFRPEIVEFEGFVNYGSPIQTTATDALGNPVTVTITENRIEMPVFSTRRVNTSLTIYDGHTVAVGGLMRENVQTLEDKVPILGDLPLVGRLFQTTAETREKSNLIIFVTARIIDATGQPVDQAVLSDPSNPGTPGLGGGGLLPTISQ